MPGLQGRKPAGWDAGIDRKTPGRKDWVDDPYEVEYKGDHPTPRNALVLLFVKRIIVS